MAATKSEAPKEKRRYKYVGAVFFYEQLWDSNFKTETLAVSEAQARSNISDQVRKKARKKGRVKLTGHLMLTV